jgi:glutathione peroxidase-family protein
MFCYDQVGAQASANLFSLVMRARANGVEPFEYLSYLFEHLSTEASVEAVEALLPWNRFLSLKEKVLVDRRGAVVSRFAPDMPPDDRAIISTIEATLLQC